MRLRRRRDEGDIESFPSERRQTSDDALSDAIDALEAVLVRAQKAFEIPKENSS